MSVSEGYHNLYEWSTNGQILQKNQKTRGIMQNTQYFQLRRILTNDMINAKSNALKGKSMKVSQNHFIANKSTNVDGCSNV